MNDLDGAIRAALFTDAELAPESPPEFQPATINVLSSTRTRSSWTPVAAAATVLVVGGLWAVSQRDPSPTTPGSQPASAPDDVMTSTTTLTQGPPTLSGAGVWQLSSLGEIDLGGGQIVEVGLSADPGGVCMSENSVRMSCDTLPSPIPATFSFQMGYDQQNRQFIWGFVRDGITPVLVTADGTETPVVLSKPNTDGIRGFAVQRLNPTGDATIVFRDRQGNQIA